MLDSLFYFNSEGIEIPFIWDLRQDKTLHCILALARKETQKEKEEEEKK